MHTSKSVAVSEEEEDTQFLFGAVNTALKGGDSSAPNTPNTPNSVGKGSVCVCVRTYVGVGVGVTLSYEISYPIRLHSTLSFFLHFFLHFVILIFTPHSLCSSFLPSLYFNVRQVTTITTATVATTATTTATVATTATVTVQASPTLS